MRKTVAQKSPKFIIASFIVPFIILLARILFNRFSQDSPPQSGPPVGDIIDTVLLILFGTSLLFAFFVSLPTLFKPKVLMATEYDSLIIEKPFGAQETIHREEIVDIDYRNYHTSSRRGPRRVHKEGKVIVKTEKKRFVIRHVDDAVKAYDALRDFLKE